MNYFFIHIIYPLKDVNLFFLIWLKKFLPVQGLLCLLRMRIEAIFQEEGAMLGSALSSKLYSRPPAQSARALLIFSGKNMCWLDEYFSKCCLWTITFRRILKHRLVLGIIFLYNYTELLDRNIVLWWDFI